jgi:neutral ceramidase
MSEKMGKLKVGAIKKEITPSLPANLVGYIRRFGKSTEIHDPLLANILLIDNGVEQVLLISLDMLFLSSDFALKVKQAVSKKLNIAKENILIAAIHTHSATGIHMFRDESLRDKNWEEKVFLTLLKGTTEAGQRLKTASLGVRMGRSTIGRNRRKEGGPIDSNFPVLCFFDERNFPLAVVASCGCHPVVLDEENLRITADYVHYFRQHLGEAFTSDAVILFFTGASGDVDPVERGSFFIADRLGMKLAQESLKIIDSMEAKVDIDIKSKETSLNIPYGWRPDPQEAEETFQHTLQQYEETVEKRDRNAEKIRKAFLLWAEELRDKASKNELPPSLRCELQCIKLGDGVLLAFPFELFSSISLSLRAKSGVKNLFMVGYANGYNGYLPDKDSINEGGYEVEEAFKYVGLLPLSANAEELFLEKALSLIKSLEE